MSTEFCQARIIAINAHSWIIIKAKPTNSEKYQYNGEQNKLNTMKGKETDFYKFQDKEPFFTKVYRVWFIKPLMRTFSISDMTITNIITLWQRTFFKIFMDEESCYLISHRQLKICIKMGKSCFVFNKAVIFKTHWVLSKD